MPVLNLPIFILLLVLPLTIQCDSPPSPADFTERGVKLAEQGLWQEAILEYDKAIAKDAGYPVAYANRAQAYLALSQLDLAIEDFEAAIQLDPSLIAAHGEQEAEALIRRSQGSIQDGDIASALADLEHSLSLAPAQSGTILILMSEARLLQGQRRAKSTGRAALADFQAALDDFQTALDLLSRSHAAAPLPADELSKRRALILVELGSLQAALNDYALAFATLEQAISADPALASAYRARASLYWLLHATELGQPDYVLRAANDMGRAVDLGLDDAFYAYLAGTWSWQARELPNAIKYLDLAISWIEAGRSYAQEGGPNTLSLAYQYRARSYALLGNCARFREDWSRAMAATSDPAMAKFLNDQIGLNIYACFR
jgi:tetratricopeptide (TPR) repeat protein